MDYEKLEQLKRLHDSGALNDEEFEKEKKKILDEEAAAKPTAVLPMGLTENAYLALMNFAMFIPYVGWIAPIVFWIMGKENSILVNLQGKYILNWYISWIPVRHRADSTFCNIHVQRHLIHKRHGLRK